MKYNITDLNKKLQSEFSENIAIHYLYEFEDKLILIVADLKYLERGFLSPDILTLEYNSKSIKIISPINLDETIKQIDSTKPVYEFNRKVFSREERINIIKQNNHFYNDDLVALIEEKLNSIPEFACCESDEKGYIEIFLFTERERELITELLQEININFLLTDDQFLISEEYFSLF